MIKLAEIERILIVSPEKRRETKKLMEMKINIYFLYVNTSSVSHHGYGHFNFQFHFIFSCFIWKIMDE